MPRKSVPLNLRADQDFKKRLDTAADVLDRPASQIVRDAVNEKLEKLASQNRRLREALERAVAA